ncbi:DUF1295-domain-containing protein [Artomyces pyxidatus]|uniref:DUF1295-domain-containing protein n=1 Tax=Artomyces pyxidatus TaxID=48021 RepID=A0ACB8TG39_9AGAM|nr:DUF1295-domain-containing protein [Artomyces pyxidatus]
MSVSPLFEYPFKLCAASTAITYILSLVTANVSQVDRVWTFLPTLYSAYWALLPLWPRTSNFYILPYVPEDVPASLTTDFSPRALLMLGLTVLWMSRLSYNTWRRGLFRLDEEDYRWAVLRKDTPAWLFQIINLTFIAGIQNALLLLLGVPTHRAITQSTPLTSNDAALAVTALALLAIEFTADNQQFAFHAYKASVASPQDASKRYVASAQWPGARLRWRPADAERGFPTRGLWAWSRHPNFFAEQSFWGVITLFPLLSSHTSAASFPWDLVPLAPSLALCTLFVSSTAFTEDISRGKYPEGYAAYQRRVSIFVPWMTPVWGALLRITGGAEEVRRVDALVWGNGKGKAE